MTNFLDIPRSPCCRRRLSIVVIFRLSFLGALLARLLLLRGVIKLEETFKKFEYFHVWQK